DVRGLHAGAERARAGGLPVCGDEAAHAGGARSVAVSAVFHSRDTGAHLLGLLLRGGLVAHRGAFERDRGRAAGVSVQDGDTDCGGAGDAAGGGGDSALHRVHQERGVAFAPEGRGGDRRRAGAARQERVCGRGVAARGDRERARHRRGGAQAHGAERMSSPFLGLTMLGLIVAAIMMGFPTAFTLMGLGMLFGYIAFWDPASHHWLDNQVFDLFVQRTYGGMNNETLLLIPLFVFMGYIIERAALVDKMFFSVQLAFRRLPASLAVTTLLVCAFWGIAGAAVVLMGVIAMRPMLKSGYDVRLASGVITAGGTLGILIPPSVMLIVYAAVAGQSIVKLYAAAMLPGFFLTFLYLVYIIAWAMINPKIAPPLDPSEYH